MNENKGNNSHDNAHNQAHDAHKNTTKAVNTIKAAKTGQGAR